MGYYAIEDETEDLQHHGIKGQKWGVRRFQRKDGTRTPAGRAREREDDNDSSTSTNTSSGHAQNGGHKVNIDKKKVATGLAIAGTVALGAALIANPGTRNVLAKYGETTLYNVGKVAGKASNFAEKTGKRVAERVDKAADAMIDAALVSVGGIAVTKLADKLTTDEDASEGEKNTKKIVFDAAKAGIETATKGTSSSNNSSNKGGNVGKEITDKLGSPTHKAVDTSSPEYQNLINSTTDKEVKNQIKSLRKQGYDIDQLQKAMDELKHSMFEDWASKYMGVEIGR